MNSPFAISGGVYSLNALTRLAACFKIFASEYISIASAITLNVSILSASLPV